jgi:hypothetical protein
MRLLLLLQSKTGIFELLGRPLLSDTSVGGKYD